MKPKSSLFSFVALLTLSACVSTRIQFSPTSMQQTFSERTSPQKIELYQSQAPTKRFMEIGYVNACCSSDSNSLIDLLKEKASENGGDALISIQVNALGGVTASVIRYL